MIFNMVGKGGGGSLLISDTLDVNGGIVRTITATKVVKLQTKTITPTSSAQTVNPDTGYDGFSQVTVEASSGSTINNQNKTVTPTESQQSITADSGYTGLGIVTINAMPAGTAGTPTATKGTVSNHSISVTPSVTNTTGYITGDTKTGTAVSVSASELVSGNIDITSDGVIDVTNYATATVPSASYYTGSNEEYYTDSGVRRWKYRGYTEVDIGQGDIEGWLSEGIQNGGWSTFDAVASGTTVTPTESAQSIGGADTMMEGAVTVNAIPSNYVGSGIIQRSASDLSIVSDRDGVGVKALAGYYNDDVLKYIDEGTKGIPTATKGTVSNHAISITPSVTNTEGWISGGTKTGTAVSVSASELVSGTLSVTSSGTKDVTNYASASIPSGSATGPSSLSGTSATVSTGTNTLTLTKTGVTTTPTVSAGYVSSATASTATVTLTASVTTKAAATITPGTTDQTIASGTYLTGTQTISGDANLIASNIKKDVTIFGKTGTYEGSGGGGSSSMMVATTTKTLTSAASSISFTGLSGEPTSFAVTSSADQTTGGTKVVAVTYNGTYLYGIDLTTQAANDTGFTKSYSNGTLTITATTASFQANEYKLVYSYGGTAANIGGGEVQVGSGATSITFTGLEDEPEYFSCIFKSTFSTSSGYQRTMEVVYDGTSTYGHALDSSAHALTSWSYTYNNGSLTISSTGTNNGGYFHQPGYYQLIYAIGGDSTLQKKTVTPTSSDQTITADTAQGYTALSQVKVEGITCTNLTASNILSGVTVKVGTATDDDSVTSVSGNVVLQNVYTGSSAPSSSTGSNGDIYIQS